MISVVMPAHNEQDYLADAVERVVTALRLRGRPFEVLVCENGSTDATAVVAASLAGTYPEVQVLSSAVADYGLALRAGFLAATGSLVINFDVDYVDFEFLDHSLQLAASDGAPAIVVGTKRGPGANDGRALGRKFVTAVFSLVLRLGFGLKVSDTHGLKLLRRAPLIPLVAACRYGGDIFDTELILRTERLGLAVREIPVNVVEQRPPRTPISRRIPRSLLGLARLRFTLWRELRRPGAGPANCRNRPRRSPRTHPR